MPAKISLVGKTFGRLKVVSEAGHRGRDRASLCICKCGTERVILNNNLAAGRTISCGCYAREATVSRNFIHGHSRRGRRTNTYGTYVAMIQRCTNSSRPRFCDYGGRGITVCKRWLHSFDNFLKDMGERPAGMTLERRNNSLGYSKSNCQWDTPKNQARNSRRNHRVTVRGVTGCISELCERFGKKVNRVKQRIRRGWNPEEAFFCFGRDRKHE